jgi:hypothetical protein
MGEYAGGGRGPLWRSPSGTLADVNDAVSALPRGPSGALRHLPTLRVGRKT